MIALAFYKGRGDWLDRLIRLVTRSPYSHVECILDYQPQFNFRNCWSSSYRDHGVRNKTINVRDGKWEIVEIKFADRDRQDFFISNLGRKYDFVGILFSQFFAWRRQNKKKWFCSEICAAALELPAPETYSPGTLKTAVEKLNEVYLKGVAGT